MRGQSNMTINIVNEGQDNQIIGANLIPDVKNAAIRIVGDNNKLIFDEVEKLHDV